MKKGELYEPGSVNFHEIRMGEIAPKILFRSCHPCFCLGLEPVMARLAMSTGIKTILNLSDSDDELEGNAALSAWYNKIYKVGNIIALKMNFNFMDEDFCRKLNRGIQFMLEHNPPYLIHCHAGVDRTGIVAAVLGALMGGTPTDIALDCITAFEFNTSALHQIGSVQDRESEIKKIMFEMFFRMNDDEGFDKNNLRPVAEKYFRNKVNLSAEEISLLRIKLSGIPDVNY